MWSQTDSVKVLPDNQNVRDQLEMGVGYKLPFFHSNGRGFSHNRRVTV